MFINRTENISYYLTAMGLTVLLICLIWGASTWSTFRNYDLLKNINFSKTEVLPVETYKVIVSELMEKPISDIRLGQVRTKIEEHPFVWATRVSAQYPGTLNIEIAERIPLGLVNMDEPVLIDLMGIVLPFDTNVEIEKIPALSNFNNAPELYPIGKPVLSTKVIEARNILFTIWKYYHPLYINLSEIRLNMEDEFEIILAERPTKINLGSENIEQKLIVLKEFEKTLKNKKLTDYRSIDLRYRNQVVVKERRA